MCLRSPPKGHLAIPCPTTAKPRTCSRGQPKRPYFETSQGHPMTDWQTNKVWNRDGPISESPKMGIPMARGLWRGPWQGAYRAKWHGADAPMARALEGRRVLGADVPIAWGLWNMRWQGGCGTAHGKATCAELPMSSWYGSPHAMGVSERPMASERQRRYPACSGATKLERFSKIILKNERPILGPEVPPTASNRMVWGNKLHLLHLSTPSLHLREVPQSANGAHQGHVSTPTIPSLSLKSSNRNRSKAFSSQGFETEV